MLISYIGVGEEEKVQLFYLFVESERDPQNDPLMIWLTGGPGCSGLSSFFYEIGISISSYILMIYFPSISNLLILYTDNRAAFYSIYVGALT